MNQRSSRFALAALIAIAAIGLGLVLALRMTDIFKRQGAETTPPGDAGQTPALPPPQPEPDIVRALRGTVTANDTAGKRYSVATPWGDRTVLYDEQTIFVETRDLTREERSKLSTQELALALTREAALTHTIAVGDAIIASSSENINGKTEFLANKITLVIK